MTITKDEGKTMKTLYIAVKLLAIVGMFVVLAVGCVTGPATSPGKDITLDLGGVKMEFVWIEELKGWVGKYEVTNGEYRKYRADHDSKVYCAADFRTYGGHSLNADRQPAVYVSYNDAVGFAEWVNKIGKLPDGYTARLPDATEWLTFAQCGDGREWPWGNELPPKYGNYADAAIKSLLRRAIEGYDDGEAVSCAVEKSGKNDWGLYGVGGNVWEWTSEQSKSGERVVRGASWFFNDAKDTLRCSYRFNFASGGHIYYLGFRLVVLR